MSYETVINFKEKLKMLSRLWSPGIIARVNDGHFKLVKFKGDFLWHRHHGTDEAFIVLYGEMTIDFRDRSTVVKQGEMLVVPKGVEHKPRARKECHALVFEAAGTLNTGDTGGSRTVSDPNWI